MKLRDKTTKDTQGDTDCQEDESYGDEDELYPCSWVPEIITRGPFLQREGGFSEPQPAFRVLNPDTPSFVPQSPTHLPERPTHELQPETPLVSSERSVSVTPPTSHCRAPDHVVIDIPEPNMTLISPVRETTDLIPTDPVGADTDNVASESLESENTSDEFFCSTVIRIVRCCPVEALGSTTSRITRHAAGRLLVHRDQCGHRCGMERF
ncbi:unnamed protein product [Xyrichtys novacula]|uniref:Unnamed protein product n=1 Tax=Xyrichtys novacula TaxID=13765 RepID=A0AAV1F7C5_XYRNO|nr:unnamed protein product [Xyrichtys novacula]